MAHHYVSYVWPACGTPILPIWNIYIWSQSMKNVRNRSKFNEQVAVFAIILPWMASYGSERSFLLIFSAKDVLAKVSWNSNAGKCQNQPTPPYFDQLAWKAPAPLRQTDSCLKWVVGIGTNIEGYKNWFIVNCNLCGIHIFEDEVEDVVFCGFCNLPSVEFSNLIN